MEPTPALHPHHPIRYVVVLVFLAVLLISTEKAGQTEIARLAAEQEAVYSQERAPELPTAPIAEEAAEPPVREAMAVPAVADDGNHLSMPTPLRGIYLTGWSAGNAKTMARILKFIDETGVNAVIVDIKDATGRLSYQPLDPELLASGVGTNRIRDLSELISTLHERGIYVIGRVAVFQDPFYAAAHPGEAFLDTRTGGIWTDYKGISWLRADSREVWDYTVAIARDAHAQGFDEINVDYVRFPSDGPLAYLDKSTLTQGRAETIRSFFAHIDPLIRGEGIVLSADLFGLVMSASDDLGIGQKLELIAPHVDVVAPMVYPSHFASGAYGVANPAQEPYTIIKTSMSRGMKKLEAIGIDPATKLRPWLQDFDLGAVYTEQMVRDQIRATEELGLDSWMLWDPRNVYTGAALTPPAESAVQ